MSKNRKAIKDHECILCHQVIKKGTEYRHQRITPWDHPDNEFFFDFKAHKECEKLWHKYGDDVDWMFPCDSGEWDELLEPERMEHEVE